SRILVQRRSLMISSVSAVRSGPGTTQTHCSESRNYASRQVLHVRVCPIDDWRAVHPCALLAEAPICFQASAITHNFYSSKLSQNQQLVKPAPQDRPHQAKRGMRVTPSDC